MNAPKPKGVNMRTLKRKLGQEAESTRDKCKDIQYPLPDLKGPSGNATRLLNQATDLMQSEGIPESAQAEFRSQATSGDYRHLLGTIREWFTIVVPTTTYEPLPDDAPLPIPDRDEEWGDETDEQQ